MKTDGVPWAPGDQKGILLKIAQLQESCPATELRIDLRLLSMQETWVQPLGWEDHLEDAMATHSSMLAWEIPWTEELQPVGLQKSPLSN